MTWPFLVSIYYGPAAKPPKRVGDRALEVGCKSPSAVAMEVQAALSRDDIGRITITRKA